MLDSDKIKYLFKNKKTKRKLVILLGCLVIGILCCCILFLNLKNKDNKKNNNEIIKNNVDSLKSEKYDSDGYAIDAEHIGKLDITSIEEVNNIKADKKTTQDGTVGPGTMEAFITALQIEIGAKDVDGGFGPETAKLIPVLKKGCESEKGITKNLIRILQYGLYCKGYGTNQEVEGKFGDGTKKAIERLQDDIGIKVTGEVNAILFKAILNTDGYVLDKKNGDENFRKMQRLVNKYYNKKLGIIAANGKYDRDTSKGMICALQEAVGANVDSSFGSDTMSKCPEKVDTSYPNDSSDKEIIHIIQYMLYANGYNRKAQFDGVYSSYIKEQVEKFQRFMCLPISSCNYSYGITTRSTMASLMVSCGDTSRSGNACDMIHKLTDDEARELAIDGYKYVGRYILNAPGGILDKETSINEIRNILSKKMAFIPIFQMNAREIKDYSAKAGNIHAINATAAAMSL